MGTGLYFKGKEQSVQQVKQIIMKGFNLKSTEEYEKFYDKFRNRLRTFEKVSRSEEKLSPRSVLFFEAVRKTSQEKTGEGYTPTQRYSEISAAPSLSSGKVSTRYAAKPSVISGEIDRLTNKFSHFIGSLPLSYQKQISKVLAQNDVEQYKRMLYDLAKKYHAEVKGAKSGIPQYSLSGGNITYGTVGFDFNQYLL